MYMLFHMFSFLRIDHNQYPYNHIFDKQRYHCCANNNDISSQFYILHSVSLFVFFSYEGLI